MIGALSLPFLGTCVIIGLVVSAWLIFKPEAPTDAEGLRPAPRPRPRRGVSRLPSGAPQARQRPPLPLQARKP